MKLIKISDNVLANPHCISSIEQKIVHGKPQVIVWVDNRSYTLEVEIMDFIKDLDCCDDDNNQFFAG